MCTVIGAILTSSTAVALFSAAVGALLAMGSAYLADARRMRREDATRFHATREQACSDFLGQVMRAQFSG